MRDVQMTRAALRDPNAVRRRCYNRSGPLRSGVGRLRSMQPLNSAGGTMGRLRQPSRRSGRAFNSRKVRSICWHRSRPSQLFPKPN
jgi:hypothetical protein